MKLEGKLQLVVVWWDRLLTEDWYLTVDLILEGEKKVKCCKGSRESR